MPAPRKVFRIEELSAARSEPPTNQHDTSRHGEILRELSTLRVMLALPFPAQTAESGIARQDDIRQLALQLRLILSAIRGTQQKQTASSGLSVPTTRLADELEAVAQDTELAVQKILAAAEHIDQAANSLAASLKGQFERGLTQDIRDCVIQIFEACNFQDLTSQRVAKVLASFAGLDRQIARALDALARVDAAPPLNGPRLGDDVGHVSQSDIDSLFERGIQSEQ
ncbi:MAG: hypothetical protein ACLP19_25485 [Xanthobacteraceae bacterium]